MKYLRIALVFLASALLFSCDKDVEFNGKAKIGFQSDTIKLGFANKYSQIPVVFEGTSNVWPLSVTVEVDTQYDGEGYPAVEDVDYYITSKEVFFGRPTDDEYEDGDEVTLTKGLEINYPLQDKDEYRIKLRITSASSDKIEISRAEAVVIASKPYIDRLVGTYTLTGDAYQMQVSGTDTTYVSQGKQESYTVNVTKSDNRLKVEGMFNTEADLQAGKNVTAFFMEVASDSKTISMPLGFANSNYMEGFGTYTGLHVVSEANELLAGPVSATFDSTYSTIFFSDEVKSNLLTFAFYNADGDFRTFYNQKRFLKNVTMVKK